MSQIAVDAFRADRDEVLAVARSLSLEEWETASDCDGWRVQDVIAHMANVCRTVVDPGSLPAGVPGDLEATQAAQAEAHRHWSSDQVLADYEGVSSKAAEALTGLQAPGVGEAVIPIENAGNYPLHMVANAFAFDHFCHLRNDILRPNGPIERPSPPADEIRVLSVDVSPVANANHLDDQALVEDLVDDAVVADTDAVGPRFPDQLRGSGRSGLTCEQVDGGPDSLLIPAG